jgi:hypothetical protein
MMPILDQIATGGLALGMLAIVIGSIVAGSISVRVAIAQPDFWRLHWGSFHERMQIRSRIGTLARQRENTARSGRIADWFLRRGTVLLIVGGMAKAIAVLIERQSP